ncbi:hypothetical protein PWT90_10366 [Aphanocladium album]|nr:hypothetical protein PWT90_10366 [Aphanocladium album]
MSRLALIAPCLLCGRMIFDAEVDNKPSWLNQFRILYSDKDVVSITGVGYYKDAYIDCWIAPPSYNQRWDDEGYAWPEGDRIGVLRQPPIQGRWGVPFHEACWTILEVAIAPGPVPLRRLFDLCRSFPIPEAEFAPQWGHYYGGLDRAHPDDGLCVEVDDEYTRHHRLCVTQITKHNPLRVPGLSPPPPPLPLVSDGELPLPPLLRFSRESPSRDVFRLLPQELRMYVAAMLSTQDFLSLRLASQLFAPLFYRQQFWTTRFGPGSERCWAFESRGWDRAMVWRRLYRLTSRRHRSQAMHNRERVWQLAAHIAKLLKPRFANPAEPVPPLDADPDDWRVASVDVQGWDAKDPYGYFQTGCVTLHESPALPLPDRIDRIAIYQSTVGEVQCIVGIKVVGTCGAVIELGYMAQGTAVNVSGKQLTGLYVASTPTSIRAVRCVFDDGSCAPWIGSLVNTSQTMQLVSSGRLSAIAACFDGCRMLSLSTTSEGWEPASLRSTAVWMGSVPSATQHLSEDVFAAMYADDGLYEPLHRSVFGGARGDSLAHLTGIQVFVTTSPCGVEFEFAPGHLDYLDTCQDLGAFPETELTSVQHFAIDGPGGERITGVDVYVLEDPNGPYPDGSVRAELYSFKSNAQGKRHARVGGGAVGRNDYRILLYDCRGRQMMG